MASSDLRCPRFFEGTLLKALRHEDFGRTLSFGIVFAEAGCGGSINSSVKDGRPTLQSVTGKGNI
jgi:hypothetical protein